MNKFDKIVKDKLVNYSSEYPSDSWANIAKALQEEEKKPRAWFWLPAILGIVALLGGVAYYLHSGYDDFGRKLQSTYSPQTPTAAITPTTLTSDTEATVSNNKAELSTVSTQNQIIQQPSYKYNANRRGQTNNGYSNTSANTLNFYTNQNHIASNEVSIGHLNQVTNSAIQQASTGASPANIQSQKDENTNTLFEYDGTRYTKGQYSNEVSCATLSSPIKGRILGKDQSVIIERAGLSMKKYLNIACPTFVQKQKRVFLELAFSNVYPHRKLTAVSPELDRYVAWRNDTEQPYLSYAIGARVSFGKKYGWMVKAGLDYTQLNEKFSFTDPEYIKSTIVKIVKPVFDDKFNIIDSVTVYKETNIPGTNEIIHYNSYKIVDVPLLAQYTIAGKKRLSYSITAGPCVNLLMSSSGIVLDQNGKSITTLAGTQIMKSNVGISAYASLAIHYQLTNNIFIGIEPNARYYPGSFTNANYGIDQRYFLTNVAASLRYKL